MATLVMLSYLLQRKGVTRRHTHTHTNNNNNSDHLLASEVNQLVTTFCGSTLQNNVLTEIHV
jgi:hypothetical protein